jgi:hypothetical protein
VRVLSATLVFVVALIQILLGSTYVLGSGYSKLKPDTVVEQSGASLVPRRLGDKASPVARRLSGDTGGARAIVLGLGTLVVALVGLAAGFLLLRRGATTVVIAGLGLCAAWLLATVLADGLLTVSAVSLCLLILALGAALIVRVRRPKMAAGTGTEGDVSELGA